jgi:hypothetical protein
MLFDDVSKEIDVRSACGHTTRIDWAMVIFD